MANVMFKRGSQEALNALTSAKIIDGSFYLTNDTDRLYIGKKEDGVNKLVELNKSITVVDSYNDLPTSDVDVGQFYYIKPGENASAPGSQKSTHGGNILAVCTAINSGTPVWVQVNPDTDTNTNDNTKTVGFSIAKKSLENGTLTYEWTLNQSTSHLGSTNTDETPLKNTFTIAAADIASLAGSAVDVTSSAVSGKSVTISTTGAGAAGNGFNITGGSNITLSGSANALQIEATDTQYTIASPAVSGATEVTSSTINLGINNGAAQGGGSVTIKAGEDLAIDDSKANEITIYHKNSTVTTGQYGVSATTAPAAGSGKIVVPNITVDAQGHITAASNQEITLPNDTNIYVGSVTADNTGKITITHAGDSNSTTSSGAVLFHKITIDGVESDPIYNQQNLGSFYSAAKIDQLIKGINAVTYKGTVFGTDATVTSLPTTGVKIGDAYLAKEDSGSYNQGDLIIATAKNNATEGADGTLASTDIDWTVVPSGSDADTYHIFNVASNKLTAHTSVNATETDILEIAGGDVLTASTNGKVITLSHDTVNRSDTGPAANATSLAAGQEVNLITEVASTDQGHISGVTTVKYKLPDDNNTTYNMSVASGTPTITLAGTNNGSSVGTQTVQFLGGTAIEVSAPANNQIQYKHANVNRGEDSTTNGGSLAHDGTITVISGITSNEQGHITQVDKTTYTLPSDNNTTYTVGITAGTPAINLIAGGTGGSNSSVNFSSDSLTLTATNNNLAINLEWGSF